MKSLDIKKGKLWDKYRFRCNYCGYEQYKWLWLLKLSLILSDKKIISCPRCHKTSCYINIFHLRHDSTDSLEKNMNREKLFDDRIR